MPSVYASTTQPQDTKTFSVPPESKLEQFWRGLTGAKSDRAWFVIAGSHVNVEEAKKQAELINAKRAGFTAEVYEPFAGDSSYKVVIGFNLSYKDAVALKQKAIGAGLPSDTFEWRYPEK